MKVLMPAYRALRPRLADWREVWWEEGLWGGEGRVFEGEVGGALIIAILRDFTRVRVTVPIGVRLRPDPGL